MFLLTDTLRFLFSYYIHPRPRHEYDGDKIVLLKVAALPANSVVVVEYYEQPEHRKTIRDQSTKRVTLKITASGEPFATLLHEVGFRIRNLDQMKIVGYYDGGKQFFERQLKVGYAGRISNLSQGNRPVPIAFISKITLR